VASAVLSGNRNFEGRVNPHVKANYLASPPLVVAYALAGSTDVDLATEPLGTGSDGKPVYLKTSGRRKKKFARGREVRAAEMFTGRYGNVFRREPAMEAIKTAEGELFTWHDSSTYIQSRRSSSDLPKEPGKIQ